jgi:hypothetical protein
LCGAIRYRIAEAPLSLYACHCTDCQRHTGSAFGLSMIVRKEALHLLRGAPEAYAVTLPDGVKRHGRFCGECATRLWGEPARFPQVFILRPGTLDDTSWLEPVGYIWVRSKQPWVQIPDGAVTFEAQPEDPMALIKAWRERAPRA